MAGVQIVEHTTSRHDEVRAVGERFRERRTTGGGAGTAVRGTVTQDRDRPGVYLSIVDPSYEEAMANSDRPDTREFAQAMAELSDGPPRFYDVDVQAVFTAVPSQDSVRA